MTNSLKFKVGDKVKSAPDSGDVEFMKATWVAIIYKVIAKNNSGGCYETVGTWTPLTNDNGNPDDFWTNHNPDAKPTLRQLWGNDLTLDGEVAS